MRCIKYLLFLFNLLFAVSGIVVIIVGIFVQKMYDSYSAFIDEKLFTTPVLIISVGVFIFIIAFFGCCGAIKESINMLTIYSFLLCLIFILEVVIGIAGFFLKDELGKMIETRMNNSLKMYDHLYYHRTWNILQFDLRCCGVQSKEDWLTFYPNGTLPHSCCPDIAMDEQCPGDKANSQGCLHALLSMLQTNFTLIISCAASITLIQLIGVIFSCCLSRSIRQYETV